MRTHAGVAATMFEALAEAGVNIQMITTSEIKVSVLVDRASATVALRAVHRAFGLDRRIEDSPTPFTPTLPFRPNLLAPVPRPPTMPRRPLPPPGMLEDLVISGIEFDEEQARITVLDVPDRPGHAWCRGSSAESPMPDIYRRHDPSRTSSSGISGARTCRSRCGGETRRGSRRRAVAAVAGDGGYPVPWSFGHRQALCSWGSGCEPIPGSRPASSGPWPISGSAPR